MEPTSVFSIATVTGIVGLILALLAFSGGLLYRLGRLEDQVDNLGRQFDQQAQQYGQLVQRFDQQVQQYGQLSQRIDQLINLVISENATTRDEFRRSHQQLLQALAHHTHDPDTGFAIFRVPPGMENPAG